MSALANFEPDTPLGWTSFYTPIQLEAFQHKPSPVKPGTSQDALHMQASKPRIA